MQTIFKIEGREFRPMKTGSFSHDIWLMQRVRAAGLGDIQIADGESENAFMERIAAQAWESGLMLELLGGSLLEVGKDPKEWTPAMALANAEFFGNVTDEDSKNTLRAQVGGILFYFFTTALSSSKTLMKSLEKTNPAGERQGTEGPSTTGIGAI